jgi:hypothetical protein
MTQDMTVPSGSNARGTKRTFVTVLELFRETCSTERIPALEVEDSQLEFLGFLTKKLKLTLIPGMSTNPLSQFVCKEDYKKAYSWYLQNQYVSLQEKRARKKEKDAAYNRARREKNKLASSVAGIDPSWKDKE